MALQDVCKWQAPDTQGLSPHLSPAGGWAVPRGCDPQTFLQTHGPRLAHGTTTLAFRFRHGVIAAADTRSSCSNYVACPASRKVIPVHQHLLGTTSGTSADCAAWYRVLQRELRLRALREGRLPSVASAAKLLSAMMSRYRGLDLCVATALCGWDRSGPALFYVYSDGTRLQGDIFSVGSGSPYAYGVLDRGYRYDMTTQEAYALARRAVAHATHRDAYSGGSVDLFHVRESGWEYVSRNDACVLYSELQKLPEPEKQEEEEASEAHPGPATPRGAGDGPGDSGLPAETETLPELLMVLSSVPPLAPNRLVQPPSSAKSFFQKSSLRACLCQTLCESSGRQPVVRGPLVVREVRRLVTADLEGLEVDCPPKEKE